MGCNWYLQSKKPQYVYPKLHLTKISWGWLPLWQIHEQGYDYDNDCDDPFAPPIHSIEDIKELVESGDWELISEEQEKLNWDEFEKQVVQWNGGDHDDPYFKPSTHLPTLGNSPYIDCLLDERGREWTHSDFR